MLGDYYAYNVDKFIKKLSIRNKYKDSLNYTTENIIYWALRDFKSRIYTKIGIYYILIISIAAIFMMKYAGSETAFYLFTFLLLSILVLGFLAFPKFAPRLDYLKQIELKMISLDDSILKASELNVDVIREFLLSKPETEEIAFLKYYYELSSKKWKEGNRNSNKNKSSYDVLSKLLGLFYFSNMKLSNSKKDLGNIYLAACIAEIGKGTLTHDLITELKKLQNIDDEKDFYEDFKQIRPSLIKTLTSIDEIKTRVETHMNNINNLPRKKK